MKKINVAINGFGRIGRLFLRSFYENHYLKSICEIKVINDLSTTDNLVYLLKYDSVHGPFGKTVSLSSQNSFMVENNNITCICEKVTPNLLPWKKWEIDIVIESTGLFTNHKDAYGHIEAGARKAIITAPSNTDTKTIVMGVNEHTYNDENVVSNASCTTNCLSPLVHVLETEGVGVEEGLMTTNHAYTASQNLVDEISKKNPRDGRAASINIIPASTGASKAISQVIPKLAGKISGMAFRVPVPNVSVVDFTFRSVKDTSIQEINTLMKKASETYLKGILDYTEEPVVSSDINHNSHSAVYDANASMQLNSKFFKLIAWYDNEWGYVNRLSDLLCFLIKKM